MKNILYLAAIAIIFASCASSTKLLQQGNYDQAIEKSVKKLIKNPSKTKEINILGKAYQLANQYDNDAIKTLKKTEQADIWDRVLVHLNNLRNRQNIVERTPQGVLQRINFREIDYNEAIAVSQQNAATYFYAHAEKLLQKGDKKSARQAFKELYKIKQYFPRYKDIDSKLSEAQDKGTCNVLFEMQNSSNTVMPKGFEVELLNVTLKNLNKLWINFDTKERKGLFYDYTILLSLKNIEVSPELVKEKEYEESVEVEDGFQYVLDEKGNVKKDTSGMDIKIPKTKLLRCNLNDINRGSYIWKKR